MHLSNPLLLGPVPSFKCTVRMRLGGMLLIPGYGTPCFSPGAGDHPCGRCSASGGLPSPCAYGQRRCRSPKQCFESTPEPDRATYPPNRRNADRAVAAGMGVWLCVSLSNHDLDFLSERHHAEHGGWLAEAGSMSPPTL